MKERKSPARGILHPASMAGQTLHRRYLPCTELAEWIEHFWIVEWNFGSVSKVVSTLPHPSVHITISEGESAVGGIGTGRFVRTLTGRGRVFGIKFLPGAFYPWFGQPVSSIVNKKLPLSRFFNNSEAFENAMLALHAHQDLVKCAEAALLKQMPEHDSRLAQVRRICENICNNRNLLRVEKICADEKLSIRQLQRLFSVWVGVSPKWMIQRYRLHEAVEELNTARTPPDWIGLAEKLGYFDQAHFIRDFRRLVGETPLAYAQKRLKQH
ncbi:MAG: AraC family transcriptional regulator [Bacteroidia bacterium]